MEDEPNNEVNEFLNYNNAIFEYEDIIEKFNDDKNIQSNKKKNGYLIEFKEFEELKNNLNHKKLKKKDLKKDESKKHFDKYKFNKIKKIKPFQIKSYEYFINMLLNKNEYILITDNLFDIICEKQYKNQSNVIYSIDKSNIIIYFEDDKKLTIDNLYKNKIYEYISNINEADRKKFDKFGNLLESMITYYKFEKKFLEELKKQKVSSLGNNSQCIYLIDKMWIDEWIYFSDYKNIKDFYFQSNIDQKIKQEIINILIEHKEEYKNTHKLNRLKILEFENKKDTEAYLKYNSFALIDSNFKIKFNSEKKDFKNINILNNKITIDISNKTKMAFDSENNIITKNEYNYLKELRQLIRIFCFQEELQNLFFELSKQKEIKKAYYLINSNIMLQYKEYFDYDILYNYLSNNHDILNEIKDKNNNINYSKLLDNKIIDSIINKLDIQYINKVKEKNAYKGELFNNEDFKINEKVVGEDKTIKYISDFAIINYDILFYFLQTNIIEEKKFIYANFLFENNKILISFKNNNNIFNEIGILDENMNFIIEYLFETQIKDIYKKINENEHFLSIVFVNQQKDFTFNFKNNKNNDTKNMNKDFNDIYFYKIQNVDNIEKRNNEIKQKEKAKINSNSIQYKNETEYKTFIFNNISSILLSFLSFNDILSKEIEQNEIFKSYSGYLINRKILSDYKNLLLYEKINKYFTINEKKEGNIYNFIEENKDYYSKLNLNNIINLFKDDNCLDPNMKEIKTKNESILFPEDFSIINETIYENLSKFYRIKNGNKISFYFSKSMLVFKYENSHNNDNSNNPNNCIIICFSRKDETKNFTFSPIFKFIYFSEEEMNKEFISLYNNIKVDNFLEGNDIIKNGNIIGLCYSLKDLKEIKDNDNKLEMYLKIWIDIYKGCSNLKNNIKNINEKCNYYIINKKLFDNLKKIFHYEEICKIINNFKKQILEENRVDLIIANLSDKTKNDLNILYEEKIKKTLSKDEYKLEIKKYKIKTKNYLDYYNNCQIINEKLLKYIQIYAGDSFENKKVECILSDEFCIIKIDNDFSINIGILDESNIFIVKNLIASNTIQNAKNIFSAIKNKGYDDFIKKINYNYAHLKPNIYNINESVNDNYVITDKLKLLILLIIYIGKFKANADIKIEGKVNLINKNFLKQFNLYEIKEPILKNDNIISLLKDININDLSNDFLVIDNIINLLGEDKLKEIDKKIAGIKIKNFYPNEKEITLPKKKIKIFEDFIILNDKLTKLFETILEIKFNLWEFNSFFINQKDIILVNNNNQHTMLVGKINNNNLNYNIEMILDYDNYEILFNLVNEINKIGYETYIKNHLIFNEENKDDLFSPIFSDKDIIGNGYKYNSSINNYSKYTNYSNFLNSEVLKKGLSLYINYKEIYKKLEEKVNLKYETYYLINHQFLQEIILESFYKNIKDELDSPKMENIIDKILNCNEIKKSLLSKFLSENLIKEILKKKSIKKNEYGNIEPDIIPLFFINNNQQQQELMIYNNFNIIHKDIIKLILGNKSVNESNLVKCIFINNKIIINLPKYLNDKYFISVIGILDYNNNYSFISEYYLIYDNENNRDKHLNSIASQLNDYLNNLNFINNISSIILNNIKIGTIVKNNEQYNNNIGTDINKNIINNIQNNNNQNNNNQNRIININENNNSQNIILNNIKDENQYSQNPYIYYYFGSCPNIGLENIGATCYMNATLQCFCHIEQLINFFKYKYNEHMKQIPKKDGDNLSSSFKILVDNLWPNNYDPSSQKNKKYYAPNDFKTKISKMNPLFEGIAANDAKDLVNFIIMTLHEELNIENKENKNLNNNYIIDQTNPVLVYQNFYQNTLCNNNSIISDLFYAINCNITLCSNCRTQIYNCQIYFFLVFPLEEVRKYIMQLMSNQFNYNNFNGNFNINEVSIYDCFDYERKQNFMSGENSMYCNYCKGNHDCYMYTNLFTGPKILIILLNRGKGIEFNVKLNFPDKLYLNNYIQFQNSGFMYKLIGVITHIGESGMGGHFIAYCVDPITNQWNKYNDSIVTEVKDFQNEIINFAMPYLLFYQKFND